jgi:hypothetical protein
MRRSDTIRGRKVEDRRKTLYVKPFLEQFGTREKPDEGEGKSDAFNTV